MSVVPPHFTVWFEETNILPSLLTGNKNNVLDSIAELSLGFKLRLMWPMHVVLEY